VQALGFQPPMPAPALPAPVPGVRTVLLARRTTLSAYVLTLRKPADGDVIRSAARALRTADPVRHHLLILLDPGTRRVSLAISAPGAPVRVAGIDISEPRESDLATVGEVIDACRGGDSAAATAIARALDRSRIGDRFFRDIVAMRDAVARGWTGLPRSATQERNALALLLLSRLLFLYFLQHRGVLDGDTAFMPRLWRDWNRGERAVSFYRCQLETLFFGVLNRRAAERTARARALGDLLYLNGGLFERHAVEERSPDHDLPDVVTGRIFTDLLERYRFTSNDASDQQADASVIAGVDPEMLGRIFEGLMPGDRRGRTGSFYTPAATVDALVRRALTYHVVGHSDLTEAAASAVLSGDGAASDDAGVAVHRVLRTIRVLDPACGSGAFLMGALARLADVRARTGLASDPGHAAMRRAIIGECLHGVDVLEDAAMICSLRLWLALLPGAGDTGTVEPLPNLDRRVRQGDALVDPLDLADMMTGRPLDTTTPPELRGLLSDLLPAAHAYMTAEPGERDALRRTLGGAERGLARAWLDALRARLDWDRRDNEARAADTDLFGEPAPHATVAERRLRAINARTAELDAFTTDLDGSARLPFFSFRVHFAEAGSGFDVILSNPPWIRAHGWPPTVRNALRSRYAVCRNAGWPAAARMAGRSSSAAAQVDLSLLFLERAGRLLSPGGTLAMLLPAKMLRSLYAGGARELVLGSMRVREIDDLSLDHRNIFDADAFPCAFIAQQGADAAASERADDVVRVTLRRAGVEPLQFETTCRQLPLTTDDLRAPWLLAPPEVTQVIRSMQQRASPIGDVFAIRRGVMTGANRVMVVRDIEPKLGGLCRIRTDGYHQAESSRTRNAYAAWIESDAVRPLLRGTDVASWRSTVRRHVLWVPANDDAGTATPPRLGRYLHRHRGVLRRNASRNAVSGRLKRLGDAACGHKVVWSDLALDLRAAAVPATVRCVTGRDTPVIPLNTVYYIAVPDAGTSMLLAAYLNSLPLRVHARVIAERAKDAHFRFFAWTIGVLPLPHSWNEGPIAERLTLLSREAHARGGATPAVQAEVDALVARAFGIGDAQLTRLVEFDAWLKGKPA
jgi:hypothetical protein